MNINLNSLETPHTLASCMLLDEVLAVFSDLGYTADVAYFGRAATFRKIKILLVSIVGANGHLL